MWRYRGPETEFRPRWYGFPAVSWMAAALSVVFFACRAIGKWRHRRGRRRRGPAADGDERASELIHDLTSDLINDLAAIRGYCELARMGHPGDPALRQRMDAAMAACNEVSDSLRKLRARRPRRHA